METFFLFSAIISLLVPFFSLLYFIYGPSYEKFRGVNKYLIFLSLLYVLLFALEIVWFLNIFYPSSLELILIVSFFIFLQSVVLILLFYEFSGNRKVFLLFIPILIIVPAILLNYSLIFLLVIASILASILSIFFFLKSQTCKSPCYSLIIYLIYALFAYSLFYFGFFNVFLFLITTKILFLIFYILLLKSLKSYSLTTRIKPIKRESLFVRTIKHFIFLVIITNFIFIGTLSIHELGHMSFASFYGCKEIKIIYDGSGVPRTEIPCYNINKRPIIFGGLIVPIIVSVALFFSGGRFMKEAAVMMFGFNLMVAYTDLIEFGLSGSISLFFVVLGGIISLFGLIQLTNSRTSEEYFENA